MDAIVIPSEEDLEETDDDSADLEVPQETSNDKEINLETSAQRLGNNNESTTEKPFPSKTEVNNKMKRQDGITANGAQKQDNELQGAFTEDTSNNGYEKSNSGDALKRSISFTEDDSALSAEELNKIITDKSTDSINAENRSESILKEEVAVTFDNSSPNEAKVPSPPSRGSFGISRKKSGSILKKSSTSSDKLSSPPKSTDFYVDASGNVRQISPNDVNTNQFYPDLSNLDQSPAVTAQDSDEVFGTPEGATREPSATRTVRFDESGPQITELEDEEQYELAEYEEDDEMDSVMRGERPYSAETSDSISLPRTSPGFFRETQSAEIFATQVDEETLEAAKIRQKRRTYILDGDNQEPVIPAIQTMKQIVEGKAKMHYEEGLAAMHSKKWERAIVCFTKSLNLNSNQVDCYVQRGEAYFQLTDFKSALLNYKKACIMEPDNPMHYQRLAFIYFFQGESYFDQKLYPKALESFSRASEMRPDLVGYHTRCIACLAALERHSECLALVNQRLEIDHSNADLYIMRARLHQLFQNITLCYYDVKDALVIDPHHEEAKMMMKGLENKAEELKKETVHLTLMKKHREALQKISMAIEANPSVPDYHILRGALQRHLADFNAAIDDYLLALDKTDHNELSPVYLEAQRQLLLTYNDFAVECFTKGYFEEAIILLNKAIKGEKREKGLYINRGDCFYKQGNLAFSLADYHQALEMDLKDDSIRSRIAVVHNEFAIREYQEKNFKEAENRLTQAIQFNPRKAPYYISRARTRLLQEDPRAAQSDIVMALQLDPNNTELKPLMARLFPGKSQKEITHGKMGAAARHVLEQINAQQGGPNRLRPLEEVSPTGGATADVRPSSSKSDSLVTWEKGHVFPNLQACVKEKELNVRLIKEKVKTAKKIQTVLHSREDLNYPFGRVKAFAEPMPVSQQALGARQEKLATKETPGVKSTGWKKFTLGVGLGT